MQIKLLSCDAQRPDKRAIAKGLMEMSSGIDPNLADELTAILLEGEEIELEVDDNTANSALRLLRKLEIDYELMED